MFCPVLQVECVSNHETDKRFLGCCCCCSTLYLRQHFASTVFNRSLDDFAEFNLVEKCVGSILSSSSMLSLFTGIEHSGNVPLRLRYAMTFNVRSSCSVGNNSGLLDDRALFNCSTLREQ
uniref:Secreted protein n=1 Tax=Schistosoma curassoni TaxID=6186 RepID=A0A183JDN2_9TREM